MKFSSFILGAALLDDGSRFVQKWYPDESLSASVVPLDTRTYSQVVCTVVTLHPRTQRVSVQQTHTVVTLWRDGGGGPWCLEGYKKRKLDGIEAYTRYTLAHIYSGRGGCATGSRVSAGCKTYDRIILRPFLNCLVAHWSCSLPRKINGIIKFFGRYAFMKLR